MVKYKSVKKLVPERYEELAPERIRYMLRGTGMHVIEAVEEKDRLIGMLAYSYSKEEGGLFWINVLPSRRGQGTGSGLMEQFFLKVQGFKLLSADLIVTDESALLQSFLMAYRFRFQKEISYDFIRELSVLSKNNALMCKAPAKGFESLKGIDRAGLRKIMADMGLDEEKEIYDTEDLDTSISCVHRNKEGRVNGVLLVNRYGDSLLEPVMLRLSDDEITIAIGLIKTSIFLADKDKKAAVKVFIRCRNQQIGMLIDTLVKNVHPIKMMKGICRGE